MKVNGRDKIEAFIKKHPEARPSLEKWIEVVTAAHWKTFADVRCSFSSADYVKPFVVFNVGGNKYRSITVVEFRAELVLIKHVLTHAEYDKEKWKQ